MFRSVMLATTLAMPALVLNACSPAAIARDAEAKGALLIAQQGSFSVGGRTIQGTGVFDPTTSPDGTNEGQTLWVDQMYVQYQIPVNPRMYPMVLVHGGGGTGRVWESTPDGREGYQTIFLRRGYPVYIVDFPVARVSPRSTVLSATWTAPKSSRT